MYAYMCIRVMSNRKHFALLLLIIQDLVNVLTVKFAWQMVTSSKREGWRCVLVECGGVFVEMVGTRRMLILSVDNWTWEKAVRKEL